MITTTVERVTAMAAVAGLAGIALFQLALALGAPLGHAAFGGVNTGTLPREWRVASVVSLLVWAAATMIVASRAGFGPLAAPGTVAGWGTWFFVGLLLVGAVMNAASSSPWERYFWAPYSLIMAALCFVVARSAVR